MKKRASKRFISLKNSNGIQTAILITLLVIKFIETFRMLFNQKSLKISISSLTDIFCYLLIKLENGNVFVNLKNHVAALNKNFCLSKKP